MPPSASSSWSAQPAASTATKKLKEKAPHMREKKGSAVNERRKKTRLVRSGFNTVPVLSWWL